jgi:hypothetical protein
MKGQRYIKTINHAERTAAQSLGGRQSSEIEHFYDEISDHWQDRAKRLKMRRWRKIREAEYS